MIPNAMALAGTVVLLAALHLQVRVVEEPYLRRTHGRHYERYAAKTGRFIPGVGNITPSAGQTSTS
jgi:protein-S-isoprenylcysteine O-methyltransferase Ste14